MSIGVQSQVQQSATNLVDAARIATSTGNARVQAVAGLASGLAAVNTVNSLKDAASTLTKGQGSLGVSVGANLGISSSRSSDMGRDETAVSSRVSGNNMTLVATEPGPKGSTTVTSSQVTAANELAIVAQGPITIASAQETDSRSGTAKSSGFTVGVWMDLGLSKDGAGKQGIGLSIARVRQTLHFAWVPASGAVHPK